MQLDKECGVCVGFFEFYLASTFTFWIWIWSSFVSSFISTGINPFIKNLVFALLFLTI